MQNKLKYRRDLKRPLTSGEVDDNFEFLAQAVSGAQFGIKNVILPNSPAPIESGQYPVKEIGVYTNFKDSNGQSISVTDDDFKEGIVYIIYNGTYSYKFIAPIPLDGEVVKGDMRGVNGNEVSEKVVLREDFLSSELSLVNLEEKSINLSGYPGDNTGFYCSDYIDVEFGDEFILYSKVTTEKDGVPGLACAASGFKADNYTTGILLSNNISKKGYFRIDSKETVKIKVSSRKGYEFRLLKISKTIPSDKVQGVEYINNFIGITPRTVLDVLFNQYINFEGLLGSSDTWRASSFIPVEMGDYFEYKGKTDFGVYTQAAIYSYRVDKKPLSIILGGYNSEVEGVYEFVIDNPEVSYLRVSSHVDVDLVLRKRFNQVRQEDVEGLDDIMNRVNTLEDIVGLLTYSSLSWAAIGDSITYADEVTKEGYQSFINNKIVFSKYQNYGFPGLGLAGDSGTDSIFNRIKQIGFFDIYTIFAGTNDFKLNHDLGEFSDFLEGDRSDTFYGSIGCVVDLLIKKNPSAKIIFLTPLRRDSDGYTSRSINEKGYCLNDYRLAIMTCCDYLGLLCVDMFNESGITDLNINVHTSDGLHPRKSGHRLVAARLISDINVSIFS